MKTYFDVFEPIGFINRRALCKVIRYRCDTEDIQGIREQLTGEQIEENEQYE